MHAFTLLSRQFVVGTAAVGADRYPTNWSTDPGRWLTPDGLLASWVAEAAGVVPERLASITRLFVVPTARALRESWRARGCPP